MIALLLVAIAGPGVELAQDEAAVIVKTTGLCSGVVVAPRVVLTAAHCVAVQAVGKGVASSVVVDGKSFAARAVVDPEFDLNVLHLGHDVAVLITDAALPVTPHSFEPEPALDDLKSVRVVGFGLHAGADAGVRRAAEIGVVRVDDRFIELAANDAAPCLGDSGGPVFAGDRLVGVVSYSQGCGPFAHVTRLSAYAPFIREQIDRSAGCGGGGSWALVIAIILLLRGLPTAANRDP